MTFYLPGFDIWVTFFMLVCTYDAFNWLGAEMTAAAAHWPGFDWPEPGPFWNSACNHGNIIKIHLRQLHERSHKDKGHVHDVVGKLLLSTWCNQWSVNPGMGKGLANSSTRWRSSAMRDTVSESSSRKDLKLARFPVRGQRNQSNTLKVLIS